jgi:hypothetical protein
MGEVYWARDTRLKRHVARKVLPAAFAADPDRLARFQREAELLASLNHPGIAAIYGTESAATGTALVLELVWRARWPSSRAATSIPKVRTPHRGKAQRSPVGTTLEAAGPRESAGAPRQLTGAWR